MAECKAPVSCDSLSRSDEELARYCGRVWLTYAMCMPAIDMSVHLGGRHSLHNTYQQIRHVSVVGGQGMALHRSRWVSSFAAADGSRFQMVGRWVRVLAFGAFARRESSTTSSAELSMSSDDAQSSKSLLR